MDNHKVTMELGPLNNLAEMPGEIHNAEELAYYMNSAQHGEPELLPPPPPLPEPVITPDEVLASYVQQSLKHERKMFASELANLNFVDVGPFYSNNHGFLFWDWDDLYRFAYRGDMMWLERRIGKTWRRSIWHVAGSSYNNRATLGVAISWLEEYASSNWLRRWFLVLFTGDADKYPIKRKHKPNG